MMRKPSQVWLRAVGALCPTIISWIAWLLFEPATYTEYTLHYLCTAALTLIQLVLIALFIIWVTPAQVDNTQ